MIAFKSHASDGSSFQVYEDNILIGHIRRQSSLNGDKFIAVIDVDGEEKSSDKVFDSPDDALQWIERQRLEMICTLKGIINPSTEVAPVVWTGDVVL